jgi:pyruvate dehydrogenase E1 component alpha subunit
MVNSGIIGAGLPIAAGLALASKLRGDGKVTACTFGDGAVNEGAFHEALNLASIWALPVVFICENNGYAETTAFHKVTASRTVVDRAAAYEMPGVSVNGSDPVAAYQAVRAAADRARAGDGPTLIEASAYRLKGHYNLDDMAYVPEAELAAARAADAVPLFREWLLDHGHASEDELAAIETEATQQIDDAYAFALASPDPAVDELLTDVWTVNA